VTIANARRAASREGSDRLLTAGVAVASAVMFRVEDYNNGGGLSRGRCRSILGNANNLRLVLI
jgi:hypothetical protein